MNNDAATSGGPKTRATDPAGSILFHSHSSATPRGKFAHHTPQTTARAGTARESQNAMRRIVMTEAKTKPTEGPPSRGLATRVEPSGRHPADDTISGGFSQSN